MRNTNGKHFVHMDDAKAALQLALSTKKNLILYGPGGYGKTELIKQTLDDMGMTYNKVIGYNSMAPEKLMGLPNLKKIEEENEYEIAFEKSPFTGAKVLVLEEFMDVDPETSAAFKDIISSKGYTYKQKFIPSDIEVIIMTSNKNPREMEMDDSLKAFYNERFTLQQKVDWPVKNAFMYNDLLTTNTDLDKDSIELLSFLYTKTKVSPRIALDSSDIYGAKKDLKSLRFIPAFADIDLGDFEETLERKRDVKRVTVTLHEALKLANEYRNDLGVLTHLQDTLLGQAFHSDIHDNERFMSFVTVKNAITANIKNITTKLVSEISPALITEIDAIFKYRK